MGERIIPWSELDLLALEVPRPVPETARIVLTDESPAGYWYVPILYVVLGVFGLLFAWALARSLRRTDSPAPLSS